MADTIEIESIRRLVIHPGETLVLTLPDHLGPGEFAALAHRLAEKLPEGVKILVTTKSAELTVITTPPGVADST